MISLITTSCWKLNWFDAPGVTAEGTYHGPRANASRARRVAATVTATLLVIAISDFFVAYWWAIFGIIFGGLFAFFQAWKRSEKMQFVMDRLLLRVPIFGDIIRKAVIARWTRTLSTMFAAGVPLVESLEAVGGASGNYVYKVASKEIQSEVSTGTSLTTAMQNTSTAQNLMRVET